MSKKQKVARNRQRDERRQRVAQPAVTQAPIYWPGYQNLHAVDHPFITSQDATNVPALWRGLHIIGGSIAAMTPPSVLGPDGKPLATPLVIAKPDPEIDCYTWYHQAVCALVLDGNFYAVPLEYDEDGTPARLLAVPNDSVQVRYDDAGRTEYRIGDQTLYPGQILHVRGYSVPGNPSGIGVVDAFRRGISGQLDLMNAQASMTAGVPSGIVKIKAKEVKAEQAALTKAEWMTAFAKGRRTPVVLSEQMEFTPITGATAEQAQLVQLRQLDIAECAFMLGLDPSDLSASVGGSNQTYANLSARLSDRVTNLTGWIRRLEEALTTLLPEGQTVRLNVENLLRTETRARYETYEVALRSGWLTPDEVREREGLPPLPVTAPAAELPEAA